MNINDSKAYESSKVKPSLSMFISSNIITTPYEKVLSILREVKKFISNFSKEQNKLIQKLDWVIKIITSRSLYSYELKEKETINKLAKDNPDFRQLVDFVSEYNEKVIKMNRKYNYILTDKLLQKPSTKLNRKKFERKSSFAINNSNFNNLLKLDEVNRQKNKTETLYNNFGNFYGLNKDKALNYINSEANSNYNKRSITSKNLNEDLKNNKYKKMNENNPFKMNSDKKKINQKKIKKKSININDELQNKNKDVIDDSSSFMNNSINFITHKSSNLPEESIRLLNLDKKSKNRYSLFPSVQKISITINNNNRNNPVNDNIKEISEEDKKVTSLKKRNTLINAVNISLTNSIVCEDKSNTKKSITNKNIPHITKDYSYFRIQNRIIHEGYNASKLINEKNFDVFILKDIIGYNNVLPFAGRAILENLGLIDEEILSVNKLDQFLVSVSKQYKQTTLYHNSLHGTDVTQSCYIFFSNSNAEKIAKTNVLDLLSIFISALGHDIGHPGFTNTFQINDSTDMAITYNDISVLENFHSSTLFKTIRKTETNIFEKLSTNDYKIIRKKMISEILATDMANHAKVISLIKSKIAISENGKDFKFNLLTGNEQTKSDEQQILLDFIIHIADLAHNTRLFCISLKWVQLLSEEFWRQGDLEKQKNLPISFLCDRENTNVPQSQKGFLTGFILPTFECLSNIFPTLKYTVENANNNLKEWQKLIDKGRITGWTPPKIKEDSSELKKSKTKNDDLKHNKNVCFIEINNNNEKKKSKINNINNISNNNQKKCNTINNERIMKSYRKEVKFSKFFKNNEEIKKTNKLKRKEFNTPVKLRINDDFSLSNTQKCNDFLLSSNKKKDKVVIECKNKNISNKGIFNKKNVNKTKK